MSNGGWAHWTPLHTTIGSIPYAGWQEMDHATLLLIFFPLKRLAAGLDAPRAWPSAVGALKTRRQIGRYVALAKAKRQRWELVGTTV